MRGFRNGELIDLRPSLHTRRFHSSTGKVAPGFETGTTEHFCLPQSYPHLRDIRSYNCWMGPMTRPWQLISLVNNRLLGIPGLAAAQRNLFRKLVPPSAAPASAADARSRSRVIAEAEGTDGRALAKVELSGISPYAFTGEILAWQAAWIAAHGTELAGAVGPIETYGLETLVKASAECGLTETHFA